MKVKRGKLISDGIFTKYFAEDLILGFRLLKIFYIIYLMLLYDTKNFKSSTIAVQ